MNLNRILALLGAAAALAAPAVATAKQDGKSHGSDRATTKAPKTRTLILKGLVSAVDPATSQVTVAVKHGNSRGRKLRGQSVVLDVSKARVSVRDANGDGARNLADVAVNDRVVAQVRVLRGVPVDPAQPLVTRRLTDAGPKPAPKPDDDHDEADES